jgi:hypothetical protein
VSASAPESPKPAGRNLRAAAALKAFHEEERFGKAYDLHLARKIWPFVAPHQKLLWLSLVVILFTSAGALVRPLIMRSAVDDGVVAGRSSVCAPTARRGSACGVATSSAARSRARWAN